MWRDVTKSYDCLYANWTIFNSNSHIDIDNRCQNCQRFHRNRSQHNMIRWITMEIDDMYIDMTDWQYFTTRTENFLFERNQSRKKKPSTLSFFFFSTMKLIKGRIEIEIIHSLKRKNCDILSNDRNFLSSLRWGFVRNVWHREKTLRFKS